MDALLSSLRSAGFSPDSFFKASGVLLMGILLIGLIARFIFGKRSDFNHAVSSAIGILFLYAATVVMYSIGGQWSRYVAPLPLVTFDGDSLNLFVFEGAHYATVCSEVLSMIILAFFVNLLDLWLPRGKKLLGWLFSRCLTVVIAIILHLVITRLFETFLPEGIVTYAPTVLLWLLMIMLATGALKFIVGLIMATVNPLIAALYTFFFASLVGRQLSKAVLTTGLLIGLICALNHFGISSIAIAAAALMAYVPFLVILVILWYLVNRML